jgi:hypothetical protein
MLHQPIHSVLRNRTFASTSITMKKQSTRQSQAINTRAPRPAASRLKRRAKRNAMKSHPKSPQKRVHALEWEQQPGQENAGEQVRYRAEHRLNLRVRRG